MKKKLLLTTLFSTTAISCGTPQKVDLNQIKEKQVYCDYEGETYGDYKECKLSLEDSMVRVGQASAKYKMVFLQVGPKELVPLIEEMLKQNNQQTKIIDLLLIMLNLFMFVNRLDLKWLNLVKV